MAKTRAQIKAIVEDRTGRAKATLENYECDNALKLALMCHDFEDAQSIPSDFAITEDATYVSISSITGLLNIVTARIVEASGSRNEKLTLKPKTWWDSHVINSEDNQKGWPIYGIRQGSTIQFDRPCETNLELRLRVTTEQTFATDATECPIALLDLFVTDYVTAQVFKSIQDMEGYNQWMLSAMGTRYLSNGQVGGLLAKAVESDSNGDTAMDLQAEPPMDSRSSSNAVSIRNLVDGHDDYGNTRTWI